MTTKPKTRKAATPNGADPVFAAIVGHKALIKEWHRLKVTLDNAECDARETQGLRPCPLIAWRNTLTIGEYAIAIAREEFLRQPGADRQQVESEYLAAKGRAAAAERAGVEWDQRAGIALLREQYEHATVAERRAAMLMARAKLTTLAGAAALITHARGEIVMRSEDDWVDWVPAALKTVAAALARMEAA